MYAFQIVARKLKKKLVFLPCVSLSLRKYNNCEPKAISVILSITHCRWSRKADELMIFICFKGFCDIMTPKFKISPKHFKTYKSPNNF